MMLVLSGSFYLSAADCEMEDLCSGVSSIALVSEKNKKIQNSIFDILREVVSPVYMDYFNISDVFRLFAEDIDNFNVLVRSYDKYIDLCEKKEKQSEYSKDNHDVFQAAGDYLDSYKEFIASHGNSIASDIMFYKLKKELGELYEEYNELNKEYNETFECSLLRSFYGYNLLEDQEWAECVKKMTPVKVERINFAEKINSLKNAMDAEYSIGVLRTNSPALLPSELYYFFN